MKVGLAILIRRCSGNSAPAIAEQLAEMGGPMTGWRPEINGAPARAYFRFDSEGERARFLEGALKVPGVSLEIATQPDHARHSGAHSAAV